MDKALSAKCDKASIDALRAALSQKASKLCVSRPHMARCCDSRNLARLECACREVVEFVEAKCRDLEARVQSSLQDISVCELCNHLPTLRTCDRALPAVLRNYRRGLTHRTKTRLSPRQLICRKLCATRLTRLT